MRLGTSTLVVTYQYSQYSQYWFLYNCQLALPEPVVPRYDSVTIVGIPMPDGCAYQGGQQVLEFPVIPILLFAVRTIVVVCGLPALGIDCLADFEIASDCLIGSVSGLCGFGIMDEEKAFSLATTPPSGRAESAGYSGSEDSSPWSPAD
eukprot:896952-Rhodomonas_salina.1